MLLVCLLRLIWLLLVWQLVLHWLVLLSLPLWEILSLRWLCILLMGVLSLLLLLLLLLLLRILSLRLLVYLIRLRVKTWVDNGLGICKLLRSLRRCGLRVLPGRDIWWWRHIYPRHWVSI
jgi:hypothetical protein